VWTAAGPPDTSPSSSTATAITAPATPGSKTDGEAYARGDQHRRYTYGDVLEQPALMLAELTELLAP
jgi:hypothetical protein